MPDAATLVCLFRQMKRALAGLWALALLSFMLSCGSSDICHCKPTAPVSEDYRHAAKHVPLPSVTPVETTVAQMLTWAVGPTPAANAPRAGQELTLYHIATAYLQNARLVSFDCDLHFEISDVPAKTATRVIVETPVDSEYYPARRTSESQLEQHHFRLRAVQASQSELPQAVPVSVLGLAFQDFEHERGTPQVASPWELHPAEVSVLP
jgi:hypothetical protein